jgi:hypothetical protein
VEFLKVDFTFLVELLFARKYTQWLTQMSISLREVIVDGGIFKTDALGRIDQIPAKIREYQRALV